MNKHCGRWVFSKIRGCLMVVAEAARGQGKGSNNRGERRGPAVGGASGTVRLVNTLALSAMLTQSLLQPLQAMAQIRADNTAPGAQRPTVLTTGNGLPQINITTPSTAGVSRNRLSQLDVDRQGAVVNNSRTNAPTQIGGWVQGNPWLATGEARVILLEVNSNNPSHLNGYIEIAGQRSEIVIANPAGLQVNGSGFINASRATLTTGEVNVQEGRLDGFTVRGGTIQIGDRGFDASLTDYTGILARAVQVDGPLHAQELQIVTGANDIDALQQNHQTIAASGSRPAFALDVSRLGGMYAGKITLIGTEAGVGVRNAGAIQAGSSGLTLNAQGDLINPGHIGSQGNAQIDNNGRFDNRGTLAVAGHAQLRPTAGLDNSGQIQSRGSLSVQTSGNITNSGGMSAGQNTTLSARDIGNTGQISAGADAHINASGQLDNSGSISAANNLDLNATQVNNRGQFNAGNLLQLSSASRFDNAGSIVVNGSVQVQAPQGIGNTGAIMSEHSVVLNTSAGIRNEGQILADGAVQLQAGGAVDNSGSISGDTGVTLDGATTFTNSGQILSGADHTINASEYIDNSGRVVADGDLRWQSTQGIDNTGQVYAGGQLQMLTGQAIDNQGLIAARGHVDLSTSASDGRIHSGSASVLAAGMAPDGFVGPGQGNLTLRGGQDSTGSVSLQGQTLAGGQLKATAGGIDLRGQDILSQDIDLRATGADIQAQGASLQAINRLSLDAQGQLQTTDGTLSASQVNIGAAQWQHERGTLLQTGTGADLAIAVDGPVNAQGATLLGNAQDLQIAAQSIDLRDATVVHAGAGELALRSQGQTQLDRAAVATGGQLSLSGTQVSATQAQITATGQSQLQAGGAVLASQALLSAGQGMRITAASLEADAAAFSAQDDLQLQVQGDVQADDTVMAANGALSLSAANLSSERSQMAGVSGPVTIQVTGTFNNREGNIQSLSAVDIQSRGLDNTQGLITGESITIDAQDGALGNSDGAILANAGLTLTSGAIDNQRGVLQGGADVSITVGGSAAIGLDNRAGQVLAGGSLSVTSSGALDNRAVTGTSGTTRSTVAAGGNTSLHTGGILNQGSDIKSAQDLDIRTGAGALDNRQMGLVAASGQLTIQTARLDNSDTQQTVNGTLSVQGVQGQTVEVQATDVINTRGALLAVDDLRITASGQVENTGGLLSSTHTLSIKDPLTQDGLNASGKTLSVVNGAGGLIVANGQLTLDARSLDNGGTIANAGRAQTQPDGSTATVDGDVHVTLSAGLNNRSGAVMQAANDMALATAATLTNAGTIEAAQVLNVVAPDIHNQSTGALRAGLIDLQTGTLNNQGLVNGSFTLIQAGTVNNTGAGRIYGDQISIAANSLNNLGGAGTDPVIASRGDMDVGVGSVTNKDGALLLTVGDLRVGGALDGAGQATGSAGAFVNSSAEVDVFGNLTLHAGSLQNVDGHGQSYSSSTTEHIKEYLPVDPGHPQYQQPLSEATGQMDWRLEYDEQYRADYVPDDGSPVIAANQWLIDEYDRTTTTSGNTGNAPARISVGGNMTVNASNTVNDKSTILVGGNFSLTGSSLQNIDGFRSTTVTEDNGTSQLSYTEERWYDWHHRQRRFFSDAVEREFSQQTQYEELSATLAVHTNPNHGARRAGAAEGVSVASQTSAQTASTGSTLNTNGSTPTPQLGQSGPGVVVRTLPGGVANPGAVSGAGATAGQQVNAPAVRVPLPSNALFQLRIGAPAGYLVETDPEFVQQRRWIGSDFMLTQLDHDPATQTQRLGDGFYEQKLVREQVAQLTGRRFLGSFTNDEEQYRALMNAGVAFAQAHALKPGIALTREQMAQLTSDIVWLVEQEVQLPDGRVQRVLVPQLYALVEHDTPTLRPGLISAKGMDINLTGGLFNSGALAARENLAINAADITNVLGTLQGHNVNLRASGGITSILGQIAARQNLSMKAGGDMVFVGGGIKAGGNARLSAGGDLLLLAYDTGKQVRAQSPRGEDGKPIGKGPEWSYERSTYDQTGVDIQVGGSLKASAGKNLVAQGVNAKVGGSTSLRAGGDMQLTTAQRGHVDSYSFFNRYKSSGDLIKIEQRIDNRDIELTNSGNSWSSGGGMNLKAGGSLSLIGAQINSQGYKASAGGSYQERAAYDVKERVSVQSIERSGPGVYLADFNNNMLALATLGERGGRTEKDRTETHIDSTRTAIVTDINAGSGTVSRSVGGDALIEGSVIRGGRINPLSAGGKVTAVAAMDTRHVEDSVFTSTIRWQSTKSKGQIEQTLHMPEIHGTIPAGVSAYQGAGGVSVQLPKGAKVRQAIETLSQEPGQEYLKALGERSDIDWQRVEALNKSLDFSKSGLTQEATIVVIIVVSILTYGAASGAGGAAATTVGASSTGAVAAGFTAGFSSLASTAAVSLINNKGDIGAVLKELGSSENAKGLLLTMATAGLTQGILSGTGLDTVNANSSVGQLLAKNTVQGISSAVLESAVMGTSLEDALKNNLQGALINTLAAKGADEIGDAAQAGQIDALGKKLAHALLGCAVGTATAGSSAGCAPGATGAVIGEMVADWYADSTGYDQLKIDANKPDASAELKQRFAIASNTMTELAKLTGAGSALLIGGDASTMQTAMGTAQNAAQNNRQLHPKETSLIASLAMEHAQRLCAGNASCDVNKVAAQYSDAMERVAEMRTDTTNEQEHKDYVTQLALAAQQDGTVAQLGGFEAYVNLLKEAGSLLAPYAGQAITVNGQVIKDDNGQTQTYFSATEQQRQNPYINTVLNQAPGSVTPGMTLRDEIRLENLQAINGSATPSYLVEDVVLGGALGRRLVVVGGKIIGKIDDLVVGKPPATTGGTVNISADDAGGYFANKYIELRDQVTQARTQAGNAAVDANGVPTGNTAVAEISVAGKPSQTVQAHSRLGNNPETVQQGFVSLPPDEQLIFKPELQVRTGSDFRKYDTEFKILEDFAQNNIQNPQVQGYINLYTERPPCDSCTNVITSQFAQRFPNMQVRVYHGNGEVSFYQGNQLQTMNVNTSNNMNWPTTPGLGLSPSTQTGGK